VIIHQVGPGDNGRGLWDGLTMDEKKAAEAAFFILAG
jgi:hypothetical protein